MACGGELVRAACLRDDERAARCLVGRQRRQHDVRGIDKVGRRAASQDHAVRVQWEEVAVAVQRFVRRTGAALAGREQLLVRDVLRVERVLLALQPATAQGIAQGGGQCAERGCHEARASAKLTQGDNAVTKRRPCHAMRARPAMSDETARDRGYFSKGDNAVLNAALEVPLQA